MVLWSTRVFNWPAADVMVPGIAVADNGDLHAKKTIRPEQ